MDADADAPAPSATTIFTTSASLLDCVDKKLVVMLRDGRKFIGVLRSFDQFANLVLHDTVERVYSGRLFGDMPRGVLLVRGENVVLLGELDLELEDDVPQQRVALHVAIEGHRAEMRGRRVRERIQNEVLHRLGFSVSDAALEDMNLY